VAARLGPEDATRVAAALTDRMAKETNPSCLSNLAECLRAIACRLRPQDADRFSARVATIVTDRITKASNNFRSNDFADILKEVREIEEDMTTFVSPDKQRAALTDIYRIAKRDEYAERSGLDKCLRAVSGWLTPEDADRTAVIITNRIAIETRVGYLADLALCLEAVSSRLGPEDAARHSDRAAAAIANRMANETDDLALQILAQSLRAVTDRLNHKVAERNAARAATILAERMDKATDDGHLTTLAVGLNAVADKLSPKDSACTAAAFIQLVAKLNLETKRGLQTEVLFRSFLTRVSPTQSGPYNLSALVASPGNGVGLPSFLFLLLSSVEPCRFSTLELVEMLKEPLCVGAARRAILDQLEIRYRQKFADQWDFVRFAQRQNLGLDFTGPPKRLAAPTR
jgi:hypothetical protein